MTRSFQRIPVWIAAAIVTALMSFGGCSSGGSSSNGSPPSLTSISVTPMNPMIPNGSQQQFKATGNFSDGSMQDLTASATWSSSNPSVATIPAGGLATTVGTGTSTIKAVSGSVPGSTVLTVMPSGGAAVPALVQHVSGSSNRKNSFTGQLCYHIQLPNGTTAGNAVIVGFTFNSNVTPHVTDDKSDSYTVYTPFFDAAHTQSIAIAAAFNVAPGARQINVCFASDPGGFVQPTVSEFANVIGLDVGPAGALGSGTSINAGNLTPTVSGDLAYTVVHSVNTNQDQTSFTAGSQPSITWQLASADLLDGFAAQYGVYNSTGAINPALSMGTSKSWLAIAALFKSGTAGSVPSGMRIVHLDHQNIPTKPAAGGNGTSFPNPLTVQFPCSGNLEVITVGGGNPPAKATSITDSNNNTWQLAGSYAVTNDPVAGIFYAANATCSGTQKLTVHWDANTGDQTILYYDVAGASASPLDKPMSMTGQQTSVGPLTVFSITPTTSSTELIFCAIPVRFNTVTGLTGGSIDANTFDGESLDGPEPVDENNGWGHFVTSSTNPVSVTWTFKSQSPTEAADFWAAVAAAFK